MNKRLKDEVDFCVRCLKKGEGVYSANRITYDKDFTCNRCLPPKTNEQARAEMQAECVAVLENSLKRHYVEYEARESIETTITKLKQLKP